MHPKKLFSHKDRMKAKARLAEAAEWKPAEDDDTSTKQTAAVENTDRVAA